jgi:PAS domain S-box-containing protein
VSSAKVMNEQYLSKFIQYLPNATAMLDQQMRYLVCSDQWQNQWELSYQLLGLSHYEIFPDLSAAWRHQAEQCLMGDLPTSKIELLMTIPNGSKQWVSWLMQPWSDQTGAIAGLMLSAEIISERKQAELDLLENQEQLEAVLDAVPGLVSWIDDDLKYLGVNRHLANSFDLPAKVFVGREVGFLQTSRKFNDFVYEFFASDLWTASREITADVKGESKTYLIVAQKYHRRQSALAAVFVGLDITLRLKTERALRRSEEKYRTLTENFPNGLVLLFDQDLRYTLAEGEELAKMGLSKTSIEGKRLNQVFLPELAQLFLPDYQLALSGGCTARQFSYLNQVYQAHILPLTNEAGEVFAGMMMTQNVTASVDAMQAVQNSEEQLRLKTIELAETLQKLNSATTQLIQKHKMSSLGQLVAAVAHEINNPVNFISGNIAHASNYAQDLLKLVELYREYYPEPVPIIDNEIEEIGLEFMKKDLPKLLSSMALGAERIRGVVRSLRQFSHLDEAAMKPVDIHEGLESTLLILQNRLQAKGGRPGITVIKQYGNLPLVECFAGQLNQVFMQILTNAIDALETENNDANSNGIVPPTIYIRTNMNHEAEVRISISDNGPGIEAENLPLIFDPLFTTKSPGRGTGIGLTIAYDLIVDKHGGNLLCHSVLGQGTEFIIEIPIHQNQIQDIDNIDELEELENNLPQFAQSDATHA